MVQIMAGCTSAHTDCQEAPITRDQDPLVEKPLTHTFERQKSVYLFAKKMQNHCLGTSSPKVSLCACNNAGHDISMGMHPNSRSEPLVRQQIAILDLLRPRPATDKALPRAHGLLGQYKERKSES